MIRPAGQRYDFRLSRRNLAGLMVACAAGWLAVAIAAYGRTAWDAGGASVCRGRLSAAQEKIDPNAATAASLRRLPGIGGEMAARIVEHRAGKRTPFRKCEDLAQVKGIGPAKVDRIQPHVSLPQAPN